MPSRWRSRSHRRRPITVCPLDFAASLSIQKRRQWRAVESSPMRHHSGSLSGEQRLAYQGRNHRNYVELDHSTLSETVLDHDGVFEAELELRIIPPIRAVFDTPIPTGTFHLLPELARRS